MTARSGGILLSLIVLLASNAYASGEAQKRWERMNQIRQEKFDLVLPEVMRENDVDMWITVNREGFDDPLTEDFGKGYVGSYGYYVFTDRGEGRIERAILGVGTALVEDNGAYDIIGSADELKAFVVASGVVFLAAGEAGRVALEALDAEDDLPAGRAAVGVLAADFSRGCEC